MAIRIYYEESDEQFRIQVYPYFERKTGNKLQVYPKQIQIFYHGLAGSREARITGVCGSEHQESLSQALPWKSGMGR